MTLLKSRLLRLTLTLAATIAMLAIAAPSPARAYVPSGCLTTATQGLWDNNCYVGNGSPYDKYGEYSLAVQRILDGLGFYSGALDGIFGSGTASATASYQSSRGLTADGIVGANTWRKLHADLDYCGTFNNGLLTSYQYDVNNGAMPCAWISRDEQNGNITWMTVIRTESCWKPMSVYGPHDYC